MDATAAATTRLDDLTCRADLAFRDVFERVFAGDPAANTRLIVEAVAAQDVEGMATLVLITPWTLNGLLFPPGEGPSELLIVQTVRRVYRGDVAPLGVYWSVNLVPDVSRLSSPSHARTLAHSFAEPFRDAVRGWARAAAA